MIMVELFPKPKPSNRHWYAYDVLLGREIIVSDSRDPEMDLARALLSRGIKGEVTVLDGRTGKARTLVNIEKAAKLRVTEEDRDGLRYRKYVEHPDNGCCAGEGRQPGGKEPDENLASFCPAADLSFPQKNYPSGTVGRSPALRELAS
jgi:hypothetical protein